MTADHGEEFWEHGGFEHGHAMWSEVTRVPLVVQVPGMAGAQVDIVVEHVDLVRGLLGRAAAPVAPTVRGEDLFTLAGRPISGSPSKACRGPPHLHRRTHRLTYNPLAGAGKSGRSTTPAWSGCASGRPRPSTASG